MTAPISPGDTAALVKIAIEASQQFVLSFGGENMPIPKGWDEIEELTKAYWAETASAAVRAVVPPGYTVVRTDDLRAVLDLAKSTNWTPELVALVERLREKVEEQ